MDLITLLQVICGIEFLTLFPCHSGSAPPCDVSVDVNGKRFCYWVKNTLQDVTSSQAICEQDDGSLAYIPNENVLLQTKALAVQQLGNFAFAFVGYRQTSQSGIAIQGTTHVQSWVAWDLIHHQPDSNAQECIAIFTDTGKFHDAPCNAHLYAICSTPYIAEVTTGVSTTEITTDASTTGISTDVSRTDTTTSTGTTNDQTTFLTTDVNAYANSTSIATCHCNCNTGFNFVINPIVNITKELQAKLDTLKKETEVNEELLSSTIRARTSASDPRPSSAYVGYFGIVLLTAIFGGIVLLDMPRVITTIKKLCNFDI